MFGVSHFFSSHFVQQECIKLIKSGSKDFYKIYSSKNHEKNVSWAAKQHIRMISKGSCDTEDWGNGCWKTSFVIQEKKLHKKYNKIYLFFKSYWPQTFEQ